MSKLREMSISTLLIATSLFFAFGSAELFMRAAIFADWFPSFGLRQAWRYADGNYDSDFWKLTYLLDTDTYGEPVGYIDPNLGWNTLSTAEDPLGIYATESYVATEFVDPILFYGDSFVGGKNNIPQKLDSLLPHRPVLNFGVGGYGVDQTYLKFRATVENFNKPMVLFGILTYDLDRSILAMRSHQKPYFDIVDSSLILRNVPVLSTTQEYIDKNPVEINSYFLRFILLRMRNLISQHWIDDLLGYTEIDKKKRIINNAILKRFNEISTTNDIQSYVVIFYAGEEIRQPTWREDYLKERLTDLAIDFFDTRSFLLDYMRETSSELEELYDEDLGHLNQNGQMVIATGLAKWISAIGD